MIHFLRLCVFTLLILYNCIFLLSSVWNLTNLKIKLEKFWPKYPGVTWFCQKLWWVNVVLTATILSEQCLIDCYFKRYPIDGDKSISMWWNVHWITLKCLIVGGIIKWGMGFLSEVHKLGGHNKMGGLKK